MSSNDGELRALQDRAVRERIALQGDCGIEVVTDGEMRRSAWTDPLTAGLGGFGRSEQIHTARLPALFGWGMHVCRGNHQSTWYADGGYDPIAAAAVLRAPRRAAVPGIRHTARRNLRAAPIVAPDKTVVLGLLTTNDPAPEPDELVMARIEEASQYVPLARLALSPQCGFASTFPGNLVDEGAQRRKLETVARVA